LGPDRNISTIRSIDQPEVILASARRLRRSQNASRIWAVIGILSGAQRFNLANHRDFEILCLFNRHSVSHNLHPFNAAAGNSNEIQKIFKRLLTYRYQLDIPPSLRFKVFESQNPAFKVLEKELKKQLTK
jgi:hypothetical protein